jgi:F420-dependent oxidoreductase-like protein
MSTKFGILTPQGWRLDLVKIADPIGKYEWMTKFAQEAERLDYDSVWVYDHFHTVPTQELETNFECWIATAGLARDTTKIRIGQMVTCNNYRNPSVLAKMASTVDVMSHGRLDFGIGAGWYEEEYMAYGIDFPDGPTRLRMLDEALQIIHAMWRDDYAKFEGNHYRVDGAINEPKGVQQPHIPIWVGGGGEKVTLKLVAKYADACNLSVRTPEEYAHKLEVLRGHCDALGRDYGSVLKTAHSFVTLVAPGQSAEEATAVPRAQMGKSQGRVLSLEEYKERVFTGSAAQVVEYLEQIRETGIEYFVMYLRNDLTNFDALQLFAEEVVRVMRR